MTVREATSKEDFEQMLDMAANHPAPEYDCDFSVYAGAVLSAVGKRDRFRAWLLMDDEGDPVGYTAAIRENYLRNEITVFDIYLTPEARGLGRFKMLTDEIKQWAEESGALRVTWTSKWPLKKWSDKLGLKLSEYATFVWEVN